MGKIWNACKRVLNVLFGWMFMGVRKLESSNPGAMLELERQKFAEAKATYNKGRAQTRAYEVKLERQLNENKKVEKKLAATVRGLLNKMKSLSAPAEVARFKAAASAKSGELMRLRSTLVQNEQQLATVKAQADEQTKVYKLKTKAYERELESLKQLISETKMSEVMSEFHEATSGNSFQVGEGLGHLRESIQERHAQAQGKIRVAQDNAGDNMDWEIEQASLDAADDDALSAMMAEFGMADEPAQQHVVETDLEAEFSVS